MRNLFVVSCLIFTILISCEEEGPLIILEESQKALVDTSYISDSPIESSFKRILLEEFSGVQCSNCPAGAAEVKNILNAFPDRVVPVTVHSEFLALPYDDGSVDLRTPDADEIANNLGPVSVKPSCFIDRKIVNGQRLIISLGSWSGIASNAIAESTPVNLDVEIINVDLAERVFRYRVTMEYSSNAENLNLAICLTESDIVATQLDGAEKVKDYVHEFVLRKLVTPYIGNPLTEDLVKNTVIIKEFEIDLDDENFDPLLEWDIANMEVVVYLRASNDEVVNAARVKIVE